MMKGVKHSAFIEFWSGNRNVGFQQWSHLNIASLAQMFPQHPVGRQVSFMHTVCVFARALLCTHLQWMDELYEWKHFFLSCRQEMRSLCWNGESPTHDTSPTHLPILVGANLNESHQWTIWMKCTAWHPDWWCYPVSALPTDRKESLLKHNHIHIPNFFHQKSEKYFWYTASGFQSIWCWSNQLPITLAAFVHIPFRNRVEWIWWLAVYSPECEQRWQWATQGALDEDP